MVHRGRGHHARLVRTRGGGADFLKFLDGALA